MSGSIGDNVFRASGVIAAAAAREGAVNWDTTPKTGTVTAEDGVGYFVNTAAAVRTVNLPAGSAGAIVAVADYTRTFNTYNCTVTPNGSEKVGGVAASAILTVNGQSATFVYVDSTEGWVNVQETQTSQVGKIPFIVACGGSESTSGDYKIHTFTGPGTFCVSNVGPGTPDQSDEASYVVVAGGGSGGATNGNNAAGGAGAGGFREGKNSSDPYSDSPLDAGSALTVSVQGYPITVGAGASAPPGTTACATQGASSIFSSITSAGGGKGGKNTQVGGAGGSGGGGGGGGPYAGGAGNTPPTPVAQGFVGGSGGGPPPDRQGGGGGGATAQGVNAVPGAAGAGGAGATSSINATPTARAGGGGGGGSPDAVCGGAGGAGNPGGTGADAPGAGGAGTANAGGGGGAAAGNALGGAGGSGVVIIRYKYQ
jgi:hypothetical protein